jgi:NADH-quinone oxidoreductase subunit N
MYAMVAFNRDSPEATEAAMKYFVLGAIASGMLLYGMSMLYGVTGSLTIPDVARALEVRGFDNVVSIFARRSQTIPLLFRVANVLRYILLQIIYFDCEVRSFTFG